MTSSRNGLDYSFHSIGPRGKIIKVIRLRLHQTEPNVIFNMSLGDFDERTNEINTDVISDNGDRDMILKTTAHAILRFCHRYPQSYVLLRGNTAIRNRLYRMSISNRLDEIKKRCLIYGLMGTEVSIFLRGRDYDGFLVKAIRDVNFNKVYE